MAKKARLPKDFEDVLKRGDVAALKAVFDAHDLDARGGYAERSALAFHNCPDELTRWLVAEGADLEAQDKYGETPLHARAGHWQGHVDLLIELGANIHSGENARGTPLHKAAGAINARNAAQLLRRGARVDALDKSGQTPLALALSRCSNAQLTGMAELAEVLLTAGAQRTHEMTKAVERAGADFEFHRGNFNPDSVGAASAALDKLYVLFEATPAPRRLMHDGKSPIVARGADWRAQHFELWQMLVPSSGAAATVQGEVIRISGRIHSELEGNGGVNWDANYRQMADAFLVHVTSGVSLDAPAVATVAGIVADAKRKEGDPIGLCEFAVQWVAQNPTPISLPRPDYDR